MDDAEQVLLEVLRQPHHRDDPRAQKYRNHLLSGFIVAPSIRHDAIDCGNEYALGLLAEAAAFRLRGKTV